MTSERYHFQMVVIENGIMAVGGYGGQKSTETLSSISSSWSRAADMPLDILNHCTVALNRKTVMVLGGYQNGEVS